jgi:hypothetical protein
VLTASAIEPVVVRELVFRGEGASTLGWLGETVGGSVRLMEGGVVLQGSRSFDVSGR